MPQWSRASINAAIATGQRQDIHLPKKVPAARIYLTARMTKDQSVQLRNDIYDQDEQLLEDTAEEATFFNQAGNHPLTAHLAQQVSWDDDCRPNGGETSPRGQMLN